MNKPRTLQRRIRFHSTGRKKTLRRDVSEPQPDAPRIPIITQLMAVAIRLDELIESGHVPDYATLARLVGVSRARITQIANLALLAPDIQEAILFLPSIASGRERITERDLRPIAAEPDWRKQRELWRQLVSAE